VLAPGTFPVENISDPYTLTVTEDPIAGGETEPNDTEADANELTQGHELVGYLDRRADVDMLRWGGADGEFTITVRADGVPLAWRAADGKPRTPGVAKIALHHGDVLRLERTDHAGDGALPGRDVPWAISVAP
jgi:hypothetical protein